VAVQLVGAADEVACWERSFCAWLPGAESASLSVHTELRGRCFKPPEQEPVLELQRDQLLSCRLPQSVPGIVAEARRGWGARSGSW